FAGHIGCRRWEGRVSPSPQGIVRNQPGAVMRERQGPRREASAFALISAPRVTGLPEGLEPCPGWVADVLWKEPNCHASQVMDGRPRLDRSLLDPDRTGILRPGDQARGGTEPIGSGEDGGKVRSRVHERREAGVRLPAREAQGFGVEPA